MDIGVLVFDGADELDIIGPARVWWAVGEVRRVIDGPDIRVHLVAEHVAPVPLSFDAVLAPTTSYAACPPLDVLIATGGGSRLDPATGRGRRFQQHHAPTIDFIARHAAAGALMASVCTGAFLLAAAGLLAGRRAATHWTARDELVAYMAARGEPFTLATERVVDDGRVVTAGGVSSGIDLALHLVGRLCGPDAGRAVARAIETETV